MQKRILVLSIGIFFIISCNPNNPSDNSIEDPVTDELTFKCSDLNKDDCLKQADKCEIINDKCYPKGTAKCGTINDLAK
jgi:hypothetical protein